MTFDAPPECLWPVTFDIQNLRFDREDVTVTVTVTQSHDGAPWPSRRPPCSGQRHLGFPLPLQAPPFESLFYRGV